MRIVLTGGGTGGHFYPLIAIAEAIQELCVEKTLIEPELFYVGPAPFDRPALLEHDIQYRASAAGRVSKKRNILDIIGAIKIGWGIIGSTIQLWSIYPDVVISTGAYAAFPTLYSARILRIPVIIYDADATPGRVSLWSSKFARWIAVAHPEAPQKFSAETRERMAQTGHPIRKEIEEPAKEGGYEFLKLDPSAPTVFFMGGSQGAVTLNETLIDALPDLIQRYNIIHQTGTANLEDVKKVTSVILRDSPYRERYRPFGLLNTLALRMSAGIATLVVGRAGSGTIFEIAAWGLPAILVPIPEDVSHDQTENAFSYARAGAAVVLEQKNLTPHLLTAEIDRIVADANLRSRMSAAARSFARPAAARKIAERALATALEHEPR
jgi:UDP-N-acetylglucosamine--N-acetylmuramyl-(pentapeptide) pyrophosphoryl-undecaprenol N-acetylglucosamine transferase